MSGVMRDTFEREGGSIRGEEDFFSVASTMPLVAVRGISGDLGEAAGCLEIPFIPRDVTPWLTAFNAYSGAFLAVSS